MKKAFAILLAIIAITVVGNYYYKQYQSKVGKNPDQASNPPTTQEKLEPLSSSVKMYTMEEVSKHGVDFDIDPELFTCWTVIRGKVYDITKYLDDHPGGESIYRACGTDGTVEFEKRPVGSGLPHSEEAKMILEKYYIGDLQK